MTSRRAFLAALPGLRLAAQEDVVFRTDVKVVNLLATVRDRQGALIRSLTAEDFEVSENGRPQRIQYFSTESDLPLTLGLLFDTSMSQEKVMNAQRGASMRFLDQVLRDRRDQVFLMQFDMAVQLRQPLTSSRRALDETLALVDTPTRRELSLQASGGTLLYRALCQASNEVMRAQNGRKALIVLSDGLDFGSEETLADAIEAAQRADTIIYSILFSGLGGSSRASMARLARETGGAFHEARRNQDLDRLFDSIQQELRSQYSLGFVSDTPVRISEFRGLRLSARRKDLKVQARDRYWARR